MALPEVDPAECLNINLTYNPSGRQEKGIYLNLPLKI
jgi:hypothetical protein